MKTVIHVWTHEFIINEEHLHKYNYLKETNFYFGLGDLIRSTIKLYNLSKVMNFHFFVDIQLHPISSFLLKKVNPYTKYVYENKHNVDYVCYGALEDYINMHKEEDIMLILTNDFYDGEITEDCRTFIQQIFTPTLLFQDFIDKKMAKIPFHKYNIMHYRINDDEFLRKPSTLVFEIYQKHLNMYKEPNDILISDTKSLKHYLYLNDDIFMFDTKLCHLGLSKDPDEIRDTLFEFFLITKAAKIKTYCKIHHISGFVKWISKIYNIPLITYH